MYKNVQEQFNKVLKHSQNLQNLELNTDKLFADWANAKRYFIARFGGKLIYEHPNVITFNLSEKERQERVDAFISKIHFEYGNFKLAGFIEENKDGFFDNKVIYPYKDKNIPVGMKIVKAFKFFENNPSLLKEIQNEASRIIQEDKIEGRLCFSVHPLDFLSLSENNHNWTSCHNLHGDYRAGNLSLMTDQCTFICYLKSNREDEYLKAFPPDVKWNSKKWRVLMFLSNNQDILFAARQYPFSIHEQMDTIKDFISCLFDLNFTSWQGKDNIIKSYQVDDFTIGLNGLYIGVGSAIKRLEDIIIDRTELHYNDLLYSTVASPMWAYKIRTGNIFSTRLSRIDVRQNTKIEMGGEVMCIHCGQHPIEEGSSMLCKEHELQYGECSSDLYGVCSCCGEHCYIEDGVWDVDDNLYCADCARDVLEVCHHCGEYYPDYMCYMHDDGHIYCPECREWLDD